MNRQKKEIIAKTVSTDESKALALGFTLEEYYAFLAFKQHKGKIMQEVGKTLAEEAEDRLLTLINSKIDQKLGMGKGQWSNMQSDFTRAKVEGFTISYTRENGFRVKLQKKRNK